MSSEPLKFRNKKVVDDTGETIFVSKAIDVSFVRRKEVVDFVTDWQDRLGVCDDNFSKEIKEYLKSLPENEIEKDVVRKYKRWRKAVLEQLQNPVANPGVRGKAKSNVVVSSLKSSDAHNVLKDKQSSAKNDKR
jgi:hypothetical protein